MSRMGCCGKATLCHDTGPLHCACTCVWAGVRERRPYLIADYFNAAVYPSAPPFDADTAGAFARWVAAAVARYEGKGIIWEIQNEPNGG
jgi:hypothetical protein